MSITFIDWERVILYFYKENTETISIGGEV
jgi:hypothetical protein